MKAILIREFKAYFQSFIGWLFLGATLFITGIYVTVYNLLSGVNDITYAVSGILFLFMISIPILTMRILAEERRQKTDQLILTAPVTVGQIVIGKFLAIAGVYSCAVLVICIYPLILQFFGEVAILQSYTSILAFYLYGLLSIAIGIFISSLTESQVIAAVLTFAALFIGFMMNGICNIISTTGNVLTKILSCFDLVTRFDSLTRGTLDLRAVLYYLTMIVLFLFLTTQIIQKRRYSVSSKNISISAYSSLSVLIAVAVTVMLNLLVQEIPERFTTFDITANKLYSLSEETKKLIGELKEDVTLYVIENKNTEDTTVGKTLSQYAGLSDHIKVEYVDPVVNPRFFTQYTDASISRNSIIAVSEKRNKVIDYSTLYEQTIDYNTYSSNVTGYDAEGQITSAISYVTNDNMKKIYMIEGHNELSLETGFYDIVEKSNIDYESINLLQYDQIPEDAESIVINAPTSDFSEDDTNKILNYLKSGGNVLIISTLTAEPMPNFQKILSHYEITTVEGLVFEEDADRYYQVPYYLLPQIEYDTVTEPVSDAFVFMPNAHGLELPETPGEGLELTPLLTTSEKAYAKTNVENAENYAREEEDRQAAFVLGVKAVKTEGDQTSIALIYSSESLFSDSADQMVSGANKKLFGATIGALVEETEGIAIPVKSYDMTYLMVPSSMAVTIGVVIILVIPVLCIISGFMIWFKRRRV